MEGSSSSDNFRNEEPDTNQNEETNINDLPEQENADNETHEVVEKDANKSLEAKQTGNSHFSKKEFLQAIDSYKIANLYCPDEDISEKSKILSNQANCYFRLKEYEACVESASRSIDLDNTFTKPLVHRANALMELERFEEAQKDLEKAAELNPKDMDIKYKVEECKNKASEHLESKKKELFSNLKDLGNKFLSNFEMSLDNFKFDKNENGSYNIRFEK